MQSIYKFLNVDDTFIPNSALIKINESKARYSSSNKMTKKIFFRIYNFFKKIPVAKQILSYAKNRGADVKIMETIDTKTIANKKTPAISPEMRAKLYRIFEKDIEETEKILGRKIKKWHLESPDLQ